MSSAVREVWSDLERLVDGDREGALVTVVHTDGSAYQRFPEASAVTLLRPEAFPGEISLGGAAILLMSHNYLADREALERVLASAEAPGYLGVLGPRSRTARLLSEIAPRGRAAEAAAEIRTPAGLDIGADTPEEIALSIVAEILAVRRKRGGRALREVGAGAAGERRSRR